MAYRFCGPKPFPITQNIHFPQALREKVNFERHYKSVF